jgi:hypothetical protein
MRENGALMDEELTERPPRPGDLASAGGLTVRAVHGPRAPIQLQKKVKVEINGTTYKCGWGETAFPLEPGRYQVTVSCRWLVFPHLGRNSIVLDVLPRKRSVVQWRPALTVFQKGKIEQLA